MSILDLLLDKSKWQAFLEYKILKSHITKKEEIELSDFINKEKYYDVSKEIINGTYVFSIPKKSLINKSGSTKKRVVYTFNNVENIILKFIVFNLSKYDKIFSDNCYSFRKNFTVKQAFYNIINNPGINNMFVYKLDISNYFNSINVSKLLVLLKDVFADDTRLYIFFKDILTANKSIFNGDMINEKRGAMAGTSMSTFFANVYLMNIDKHFQDLDVIYARYSDDIIIMDKNLDNLQKNIAYIHRVINDYGLIINSDKEEMFLPQTPWHFLGFEYNNGTVDLSDVTLKKIKDKIRRKGRALFRWKIRKEKTNQHAIKVMLRVFNNKFYKEDHQKDLNWSKWFFPVITTHKKLQLIDNYLIQYLRYLSTGRFSKKNFNITYSYLKDLGYRSLVNEYHKSKK